MLGSYPRVPSSSVSVWSLGHLYLVAIAAFLGACTPGPETLQRVAIKAPKEIRAGSIRGVGVENQKVEPVEPVRKVGEEGGGQAQEVANLETDLTNFKDRLATLSGAEVLKLMGPPEFERFDPPARIWQYRAPACVLNLFLYHNRGGLAVEYVELRTRRTVSDDVNDRDCFVSNIRRLPQKTGEAAPGADLS